MNSSSTYRGTVYPWHCDHNGHMNIMWYVGKFDEANWNLFALIGLTPSYLRESGRGIRLREALAHHRCRQLVRHQVAGFDDRLDLLAELGSGRDSGAEHITRGDRRDAERLRDADTLGAFAGSLRTDDEQPGSRHRRSPS